MPGDADVTLDRLRTPAAVEVLLLEGAAFGEAARGAREAHRHDYHELIWVRAGEGEHLIDDVPAAVVPGTVTVIGRGQVHVFRWARDLHGAVVRFTDELLLGGGERIVTGFLLAGGGGRTVPVADAASFEAVVRALHAEARRPPDPYAGDLQRNLVSTILLWLERGYDATRTERRDADDAAVQLHRRFAALLDQDFARHHDAAHYADALAVPPAVLSRALSGLTGRTTKELVTDRVMLEAARLLRFTDASVQEVAARVGHDDPLYFSRAFKRHTGQAPQAWRDARR